MKKSLALSLLGSSLMLCSNSAKADWDTWGTKSGGSKIVVEEMTPGGASLVSAITNLFQFNSETGDSTLVDSYQHCDGTDHHHQHLCNAFSAEDSSYDPISGKLEFKSFNGSKRITYDITNNSWSQSDFDRPSDSYTHIFSRSSIKSNTDGTVSLGNQSANIDITSEGLAIDGEPLITKKANGELHIGKNSWITKEENGKQKVWAKDAAGNSIPIDYTNGTKLLINGRDVEQSINNVGALSAALTGLPTVPADTTLACGLGTGTHGGDFAFSGGCASKVNETLSINYAASMTMPGQDYAGDFEDTFSARAGFVWKLGKATKPTQISMKETKELKEEIADLKENNKNIIAQNNALLARLEKLENITLKFQSSLEMISVAKKTNF